MKDATRMVWLAIAESGKCTPAEIKEALPAVPVNVIHKRLNNMLGAGMLTRFQDGTVGVTQSNSFPHGLTVREAFDALGVR